MKLASVALLVGLLWACRGAAVTVSPVTRSEAPPTPAPAPAPAEMLVGKWRQAGIDREQIIELNEGRVHVKGAESAAYENNVLSIRFPKVRKGYISTGPNSPVYTWQFEYIFTFYPPATLKGKLLSHRFDYMKGDGRGIGDRPPGTDISYVTWEKIDEIERATVNLAIDDKMVGTWRLTGQSRHRSGSVSGIEWDFKITLERGIYKVQGFVAKLENDILTFETMAGIQRITYQLTRMADGSFKGRLTSYDSKGAAENTGEILMRKVSK